MTDKLPTVDDFASYPHMVEEVTAARLAEYLAVEAHWSASLNQTYFQTMMAAHKSGENYPDEAAQYNLNSALMAAEHSACFLLRKLIEHAPDKANEIAAEMWGDWEDPPLLALTWPVLESYGIDPQAVTDAAQKRWQTVKASTAETSEVHPDQAEIPAGGES
jgi:hypothetical protein